MLNDIYSRAEHKMDSSIEALKRDLGTVRTGRASLALLDDIRVDYYGTPTPVDQVANLSVPEGNLIVVQPWDPTQIGDIERAILKANIGLTPTNDGKVIRLPVPPLTEERRKEMAKRVREMGETGKTAVRNVRREANEEVKTAKKSGDVSEDDEKKGLKHIQDMTDKAIDRIDESVKGKEEQVLGR